MLVQWLQRKRRNKWAVDRLHHSVLGQSLKPEFYFDGGVRDNFSGRFELTSLHAALLFRRLRGLGSVGKSLAQESFDALFEGFDEALRDLGTGDLSVGRKIRKMGEAFYGRAKAYEEALAPDAKSDALENAILRNLGVSEDKVALFAEYARSVETILARHDDRALLSGEISWPKAVSH